MVIMIVQPTDENRRCPRTLKYLQGVASGRWVVDHQCESTALGVPLWTMPCLSCSLCRDQRQSGEYAEDCPARGMLYCGHCPLFHTSLGLRAHMR